MVIWGMWCVQWCHGSVRVCDGMWVMCEGVGLCGSMKVDFVVCVIWWWCVCQDGHLI